MSTMNNLDRWVTALGYDREPESLIKRGEPIGARPYAAELDDMLNPKGRIKANAVYCVKDTPTVCFIEALSNERANRVDELRQSLWNQGLITVIFLIRPQRLAAIPVLDKNANPEEVIYDQAASEGLWSPAEFNTGFIYDRRPEWFAPEQRVDRRLLKNLHAVVKNLRRLGMQSGTAEALIAQVIFLCYLEQRNIVGEHYRNVHKLTTLHAYIKQQDGVGVDRLLDQLAKDFNGDFLRSSEESTPWSTIPVDAFTIIDQFLSCVDLETGQGNLWNYDFSQIPVELISGIYETFLKDRQGELSAYYTPRHLANFVIEQAFSGHTGDALPKIYDGACGSGILLTTAFRKMLRAAEVRRNRKLSLAQRIELMKQTIHGSDIDKTACWITAFSLYLSLLEGLTVRDISLLQRGENSRLPNLIGAKNNISSGPSHGDFFAKSNHLASTKQFDVFLSNPPWRESKRDEVTSWEKWALEQKPPLPLANRQIAAGFAFRAHQCVKDNGRIVLLLPLNLVISKSKMEFRQRWMQLVNIERIVNFADIRHLLFPHSVHPCVIVSARCRAAEEEIIFGDDESIEYWVPKADASLALGRLTLHSSDRTVLPSRQFYSDANLLISYYWGNERDVGLLRRICKFGTLRRAMASQPGAAWVSAKGFHAPNNSNVSRSLGLLTNLRYLPADNFPKDIPVISGDNRLVAVSAHYSIVASPGGKKGRLYSGPRVLFTDGMTEDFRLKAVYTDKPFAFQSSIGAIGGNSTDEALMRFITAYLRSPLASYLLVMTGSSLAFERPRVSLEEIEELPFCVPSMHPMPLLAEKTVSEVSSILEEIENANEALQAGMAMLHQERLNQLVFKYFLLDDNDKRLVEDMMNYVAPSIQPDSLSAFPTPLLRRPSSSEVSKYAEILWNTLNSWQRIRHGTGCFKIEVMGDDGFLGAVRISVAEPSEAGAPSRASESSVRELIADIEASLRQQLDSDGDSPTMIPNLIIAVDSCLYVLKFLRRRYWLSRAALADADAIVRSIDLVSWGEANL